MLSRGPVLQICKNRGPVRAQFYKVVTYKSLCKNMARAYGGDANKMSPLNLGGGGTNRKDSNFVRDLPDFTR